jgi:hypothetical protein
LKKLAFLLLLIVFSFLLKAQNAACNLKPPSLTIHFGAGNVTDVNNASLSNYDRTSGSCPRDGYYTYTSFTEDCFRGDWHTIVEDHTPGDNAGNMLVVNSSYSPGTFLTTTINSLKSGATYEFGVWLMNVCRISDKCPYPLLPNITIRIQTLAGKTVAQFNTGDVARLATPYWTQYKALFTAPLAATTLILTMINNAPGGCGNDFALDDITFRECVPPPPIVKATAKTPVVKKSPVVRKPAPKKVIPPIVKTQQPVRQIERPQKEVIVQTLPVQKQTLPVFPPPPPVLTTRTNPLIKQIDTEAGQVRLDLYDNGEIDGDTVSIYHNNKLVVSKARISQKPITFYISIDAAQPHHELIMVAENLGSIPPNTSLMIVTAGTKRYEVYISSSEQKNAKVILNLRQ